MASQSNSDSIVSLTHANSFLWKRAWFSNKTRQAGCGQQVVRCFFFFLTRYILMDFPGLKALFRTPQMALQRWWLLREPVFLLAFLSRSPWLFMEKKDLFPLFFLPRVGGYCFYTTCLWVPSRATLEAPQKESVGLSSAWHFIVSLRECVYLFFSFYI